jgi:hypothetical protein
MMTAETGLQLLGTTKRLQCVACGQISEVNINNVVPFSACKREDDDLVMNAVKESILLDQSHVQRIKFASVDPIDHTGHGNRIQSSIRANIENDILRLHRSNPPHHQRFFAAECLNPPQETSVARSESQSFTTELCFCDWIECLYDLIGPNRTTVQSE